MPDYAGAVAAIKARAVSQWTGVLGYPSTSIAYVNKQPEPPFPPIDPATGNPAPVLVCEVAGTKSDPYTFGNVGNRFFVYDGLIILHVLVPIDEGDERASQVASNVAETFRAATFYVDANGSYVRTITPNPPDGGSKADVEGIQIGASFRVTVTTLFQYFHRA